MHTVQHQVCKLLTAESPTPGLLLFVCGFRSLRTTDALPQGQPADLLPLPADHLHLPPQLSHVGAGFRTRQEHVWKRPAFDTG